MHILTDGLGPREIKVRGHHGRELATYEVGGWFGQLQWETNRALLMEAFGKKKTAGALRARRVRAGQRDPPDRLPLTDRRASP